jgi:phosphoribosyl-AMP cyclohydrolase
MPIDKGVFAHLKFDQAGLIPAIIQSATSGRVLMMAWMNHESLSQSLEIGQTVFWSRSRNKIWHKGATSGNTQEIVSIEADCDSDALLIKVNERGPACHTGSESCFDIETLYLSVEEDS